MLTLVAVLVVAAFIMSTGLTSACIRFGEWKRLHDTFGAKGHAKPVVRRVPNIGGVAIFLTIVLPVLLGIALVWDPTSAIARAYPDIEKFLAGMREKTGEALILLLCLLVLHIVGLIDDRRALGALPKFLIMTGAAVTLVIGADVRLFTFLESQGQWGGWASIALTILWFVAVTNAMNFIDNMDGLSAGVGSVASAFFLVTAVLNAQWFVAMMLALLLGALLGFLVFNAPRTSGGGGAKIFMGDGGSLVVGFLLAFLTVRITFANPTGDALPGAIIKSSPWHAVFMPLCVLAIPLYDLASVTVIRLSQGKSPFVGDQQHFSHRLRARGLSVRRTVGVICGCTALTGLSGIILGRVEGWPAILVGGQTVLVLALLAFYEHGAHRKQFHHGDHGEPRRKN